MRIARFLKEKQRLGIRFISIAPGIILRGAVSFLAKSGSVTSKIKRWLPTRRFS